MSRVGLPRFLYGLAFLAIFEAGAALMLLAQWLGIAYVCEADPWPWGLPWSGSTVAVTPLGLTCRELYVQPGQTPAAVRVVLLPSMVSLFLLLVALGITLVRLRRAWVCYSANQDRASVHMAKGMTQTSPESRSMAKEQLFARAARAIGKPVSWTSLIAVLLAAALAVLLLQWPVLLWSCRDYLFHGAGASFVEAYGNPTGVTCVLRTPPPPGWHTSGIDMVAIFLLPSAVAVVGLSAALATTLHLRQRQK